MTWLHFSLLSVKSGHDYSQNTSSLASLVTGVDLYIKGRNNVLGIKE
jgi:hypothetical protein